MIASRLRHAGREGGSRPHRVALLGSGPHGPHRDGSAQTAIDTQAVPSESIELAWPATRPPASRRARPGPREAETVTRAHPFLAASALGFCLVLLSPGALPEAR